MIESVLPTEPYGYREEERPVLEEIFRLRVGRHLSYRDIVARLNGAGLRTRYGREWNPGTVKRIVDRGRPHVDRARSSEKVTASARRGT